MGVERCSRRARRLVPTRAAGALLLAATAALLVAAGSVHAQLTPATLVACGACHGADGNAPIPAFPSLAGQPALFIENQLVLIREGLREVPSMKPVMDGLTDAEIVALSKHYAALPVTPRTGARQLEKARLGEQTARKMLCGTCHLPTFRGQAQVPRLAGQNEEYLLLAMKQFRDSPGPGRDTIMAASLYGASDADLANLAHFLAHHTP
jgi:cytochrome c553